MAVATLEALFPHALQLRAVLSDEAIERCRLRAAHVVTVGGLALGHGEDLAAWQ